MKKLIILLTVLLMVLVACGPDREADDSGDSNANGAEQGQPETLTIWAIDEQSSVIEGIASGFTDETGIAVEVVPFAMDEQEEAMSLDGPSGRGPDLFYQPGIGNLTLKGLVQPMEVDQEVLDSYSEGSVEALSYEGTVYGLPAVVETLAMYYNKDLVPEPPQTMEELKIIAEELTNVASDEYGFLYPATDFYYSFPFMAGYGAEIFAEDNGIFNVDEIGLASDAAVRGGELIQSWIDNGFIPKGVTSDIASGLFNDGKVGVVINGPWALTDYKEALGDSLGTAPLPQLDNGDYPKTFLGTKGWMLSAYTDYPEEATDLAVYLTSESSLQQYFEETAEMPAKSAILSSDAFQNDELLTGFGTQLERAQPFPATPALSAVWDPMEDALTFITEGANVEDVLNDAVAEIKQDIDMNYK